MSVGNKYNSPGNDDAHYRGDVQPIDFVQSYRMELEPANVIKYVCRHDRKAGKLDLEKAKWYLNLMLERDIILPLNNLRKCQLAASCFGCSGFLGAEGLDPIPLPVFFSAQEHLGDDEREIITCIVLYKEEANREQLLDACALLDELIERYNQ